MERFHQTVKKWLDHQPRPTTVGQLRALLDHFRTYYNTIRPHRALNRRTPAQAYTARPTGCPNRHPDRIDSSSVITLRHTSRLHHIGLGQCHARTRVLVLVRNRHLRVLDADGGELLRELTLDPTRDYQPQAPM